MAIAFRQAHVEASSVSHIDSSVTQHQVLGFRASFGFDQQVSEAYITVPKLVDSDVDHFMSDQVTVLGGAGAHSGATRFVGYVRDVQRGLSPYSSILVCKGPLTFAAEYENPEGIGIIGGLRLYDILAGIGVNSFRGTDQQIVQGVLHKSGAPYSAGNILGTGRMMGQANPDAWYWKAGTPTDVDRPFWPVIEAGQTGLNYINEVDRISAFADWVTNPSAPTGGFYRTYDGLNGTTYRHLIGGRPRNAVDYTFTEGVDILRGNSGRPYPQANYVVIKGYDHGGAFGKPIGPEAYAFQGSNPFMGSTSKHTHSWGSPLIEWVDEAAAASYGTLLGESQPVGMSCEMVSKADMLDVNRIAVSLSMTTALDYVLWPGQTHLVQGPGGNWDRLGVGEKLWLQHLDIECSPVGPVLVWSQSMRYIGGGSPDSGLTLPPS